jgi:hypothetical protein
VRKNILCYFFYLLFPFFQEIYEQQAMKGGGRPTGRYRVFYENIWATNGWGCDEKCFLR